MMPVSGEKCLTENEFPWTPDEISKVSSLLAAIEQHKETLLDWIRQPPDAWAQWHNSFSNFDELARQI